MESEKGDELNNFISSQAIWEFLNNFLIKVEFYPQLLEYSTL